MTIYVTPPSGKRSQLPQFFTNDHEIFTECVKQTYFKSQISCKSLVSIIKKLTDRVESLETTIAGLASKEEPSIQPQPDTPDLSQRVKDLEEALEERTNRQLRKTLVFRNIPEHESEKKWSATKDLLATKISDVMEDVDKSEALQMIDRCHRGGKKTDETTGHRQSTDQYMQQCSIGRIAKVFFKLLESPSLDFTQTINTDARLPQDAMKH